ncbi:MAG TPA: IPExxxVDY family protein [Bacteroidia bacterium]|nr:IPExxxVDY family protein [Bacteroidia bacterium]
MSNLTKYKLDEFEETNDAVIIGIVSSAPDYTLCWHINKLLQVNMFRCKDIKIELISKIKKSQVINLFSDEVKDEIENTHLSFHHAFKYIDEQFFSEYYLITNKGTQGFIENSLKKVNYFFEINGIKSENHEQLVFDLNSVEIIELAYFIGNESLISKFQIAI